ncbi:MAG: hypothetical protein ACRC4M_03420, partial [Mycoplasma sp.]
PSNELVTLCENVSRIFSADICGIDILESNGIFYICEINTIPGISYKDAHEIANKVISAFLE